MQSFILEVILYFSKKFDLQLKSITFYTIRTNKSKIREIGWLISFIDCTLCGTQKKEGGGYRKKLCNNFF